MDKARMIRTIARIEALDRGRFAEELTARLLRLSTDAAPDPESHRLLAEVMAVSLRAHIAAMPALLERMDGWVREAGRRAGPLVDMAERYWRRQDDEIDEQKYGLIGLVDDAYVIAWLARQFVEGGMPLPDGLDLASFIGTCEHLLGEQVVGRIHARIIAAVPPPAAAPAPPAATAVNLDRRLVGPWHHSTFYSSGGFSHSSTRSRYLGGDGRYVEGAQSFVNMVHRNSMGDETGTTSAANAGADERGRWSTAGSHLTLAADNGDVYEFRFEYHGDSLMLSQPGREPKLWTRN